MTVEVMNERRAYVSNAGDYGPFEFATSWKYLGALMDVKIKYMITDLQEPNIQVVKTTMRQGEHGQEVGVGGLDRLILSDPDVLAAFTAHVENEVKKIAR